MWLYADIRNIADIARYHARHAPAKKALVEPRRALSFAGLDRASSGVGAGIAARGIAPGSNIGFAGKNSIEYFVALFGANKAGCAIAPFNWRLSVPELVAIVDDAQCPLVLVDREFAQTLQAVQARCAHRFEIVVFDSTADAADALPAHLGAAGQADPRVEAAPRATALLIYTSGTTGRPKGVQISHLGLSYMRLCEHMEPALQWRADDVIMMIMPNFHLVGTGLSLQGLYNGCTVSILAAMDAGRLLEIIQRDRPTICPLVPTAIQMLLDHPAASATDFSSLRLVMYAGAPIGSQLLKRAMREMKCRFMQFYGATETSGAATLLRPEQHDPDNEARLRSCGTPLPLIEIKIVDGAGNEVPPGATGEFLIRSPSLFEGYWKQPEATAAVLQDGWYRSGDAGFRDAEGLYYIIDRVKDMIVTGGENVYSAEVEQALQKHPAVKMSAVVGTPDPRWGEKVTAVVVLAAGAAVTAEELIAHCRAHIAGYKVPKAIEFAEILPMTATGKILKRAVRERYWQDRERAIG
ncbi:MAG: long-chain-fatty-acid--CoA ligase [Nevskia sp.]|nr:long-chain-fatty-acid--CoA ligase [Nevskia sp.]